MNIFNPLRNDRGDGNGVFRMEFPLMQWFAAGLLKLFGNHLMVTRVFMFLIGLFSILGFYKLLFHIFQNETIALIGAWTLNFSPSFYYHTINPMPDNLALCFAIWGLALFFWWIRKSKNHLLVLSGFLLSLGALCKLPFILYFIVPITFFILEISKKGLKKFLVRQAILGLFLIILPLSWYVLAVPEWHGNGIVMGLLKDNVPFSTSLDYLKFNLISNLPELLLNYGSLPFFLIGFYFIFKKKLFKNRLFPIFLAWSAVVLLYYFYEINLIGKIHDYYLFPFFPLLFIIVSYGAYHILSLNFKIASYVVFFLLLILPFTAFLRMQSRWDMNSPGFNKDLLTYKAELQNAVPKNSLCVAGNDDSHFIFFYYIGKKGWCFQNDGLDAFNLESMISKGAEYLYSDSRIVDSNNEIQLYLDKLVLQRGSIKVYQLKKKKSG